MAENITDQIANDPAIYMYTWRRSCRYSLAAISVPTGIDSRVGVISEIPINPYVALNLTNLRLLGVNTLRLGLWRLPVILCLIQSNP